MRYYDGLALLIAACFLLAWTDSLSASQQDILEEPDEPLDGTPLEALANPVKMIHPTFNRAYIDNSHNTVLETDRRSFRLMNRTLEVGSGQVEVDVIASFNMHRQNLSIISDQVFGTIKHEYALRHLAAVLKDDNSKFPVAVRAFDFIKTLDESNAGYIGVAFTDQRVYVLKHQLSYNYSKIMVDPFAILQDNSSAVVNQLHLGSNRPMYRIASATIRRRDGKGGTEEFPVNYYDEAGYEHSFKIVQEKGRDPRISTYFIDPKSFKSEGPVSLSFEQTQEIDKILKSPNGDARKVMKQSFDHAFVEAITLFNGSLAYSRALFSEKPLKIDSQFVDDGIWPRFLLAKSGPKLLSILAIEAYEYKGELVYHIFDSSQSDNLIATGPNYWYCRFKSKLDVGKLTYPDNPETNGCFYKARPLFSAPIDVVHVPRCDATFLFYQDFYQKEHPANPILAMSRRVIVDWMKFPINAMLFHKDRLYMFGTANRLFISNEGIDCDMKKVKIESEHYQSDLLMFTGLDLKSYEPRWPSYDSERYMNALGQWDPPLDETKDIGPSMLLDFIQSPADRPEQLPKPKPDPSPGPGPSRTGSSMTTIVIIGIIIIGITFACIYYFYFATAPDGQTDQQQRPMQPVPVTVGVAPSAVASTVGPMPTVRSADASHLNTSGTGPVPAPVPVPVPVKSITKSVASKSPALAKRSASKRSAARSPSLRRTKSGAGALAAAKSSSPNKSPTSRPNAQTKSLGSKATNSSGPTSPRKSPRSRGKSSNSPRMSSGPAQ